MALNPINRQEPPPVGTRWAQDGARFRRWMDEDSRNQVNALRQLALAANLVTPAYSPTIALNLSLGALQKIIATDGNAFTISVTASSVTQLATWALIIENSSGGALGSVTFDSAIHQTGFSAPANGQRTTVQFYIEATSPPAHYQLGAWSGAF